MTPRVELIENASDLRQLRNFQSNSERSKIGRNGTTSSKSESSSSSSSSSRSQVHLLLLILRVVQRRRMFYLRVIFLLDCMLSRRQLCFHCVSHCVELHHSSSGHLVLLIPLLVVAMSDHSHVQHDRHFVVLCIIEPSLQSIHGSSPLTTATHR